MFIFYKIIYILSGRPPSAGFCYGESAPANFDVCELVATEGSCYNDGRVDRLTTANQTDRQPKVKEAIINKMAVSRERKTENRRISLEELHDGRFQPVENTRGAPTL